MTAYSFSQPWLSMQSDPAQAASSSEWAHLRTYLQGLDSGTVSLFNPHFLNATIDSLTAGGGGNTSFLTNIIMNGNKITGLAAGTTNGDALRYEQVIGLYLLLTGGNLTGAIDMGSNKITSLTPGTVSTDAANFGQIAGFRILQVQSGSLMTTFSTTSSTFQATGLSVTITPGSTGSAILVFSAGELGQSAALPVAYATIKRGATNLGTANGLTAIDVAAVTHAPCSMVVYDSPATSSAVTYQVYIRNSDNTNAVKWNVDTATTVIYAVEIG